MKLLLHRFLHDRLGTFKLAIVSHPLFIVGLVVKIYAATLFASTNFGTLFVPFLKYYILSGFQDPYLYFHSLGITEVFPYPQLMLFVMALPGILLSPLLHPEIFTTTTGDLLIFQLPILIADVLILLVLARWLKNHLRSLLIFYWLSPILFYINYLHVQLDVIPIALVFLFLHYLFREKWLIAFLFLGASIATKFHIAILLPFILIYLWHKHRRAYLIGSALTIVGGLFLLINNVQLLSPAFLEIVFQNQQQGKVFDLDLGFDDGSVVYLLPLAYTLLFLHGLTFRRFNRDTFVMFLGFSFGLLTLFIPPMPGWYYWVVPFLIYFYIKNTRFPKLLLIILTCCYFLYFALRPDSDFFTLFFYVAPSIAALPNFYEILTAYGLPAAFFSNVAFTLLQASLLMNVLWVYRRGVEESKKRKLFNMPFLLGIAGDSGSGKTTLTKLLTEVFGENEVAEVAGDALHRWERGNEMWQHYTHLDPKANKLHEDLIHIQQLQNGEDTFRRHYDHHSGTFTSAERLRSKRLIIFEGLHSFYLTTMAKLLDFKVFIMPEEQLRIHWKVKRDMTERGHSRERILSQIKQREKDAAEYIASQEPLADTTFTLRAEHIAEEQLGSDIPLSLFLEVRCDNALDVDPLLSALSDVPTLRIEHRFVGRSQLIRFYGSLTTKETESVAQSVMPLLYDISVHEPRFSSGYNGIMQLFLCFAILSRLEP